jgi:hypothetical protein
VPDRHLELILKSTSGSVTERFNDQNRAADVLETAIKEIPLTPNPPQPYVMRDERTGTVLAPSEKLAALGVETGDTILIQAGTPIDG